MGKQFSRFLVPFALLGCQVSETTSASKLYGARAQLAVPQGFISDSIDSPDGLVDADVSTNMGVFRRPVRLSKKGIKCVEWSSRSCVPFLGNLKSDGSAKGAMKTGELVSIQLVDAR